MGPAAAAWRAICRSAQAGQSGRTLGQAGSLVRPALCLKALLCVVAMLHCCPPCNLDSSSRLPDMSILPACR